MPIQPSGPGDPRQAVYCRCLYSPPGPGPQVAQQAVYIGAYTALRVQGPQAARWAVWVPIQPFRSETSAQVQLAMIDDDYVSSL